MSLHVVMMCLVLRGFETKFSDHDMFHDLCNHDIYISDGYGFKLRGANQNFQPGSPYLVCGLEGSRTLVTRVLSCIAGPSLLGPEVDGRARGSPAPCGKRQFKH